MNQQQEQKALTLGITGCTLTLMVINITNLKAKLEAYQDAPGVALAMEISTKIDELHEHVEGLLRSMAEVEA